MLSIALGVQILFDAQSQGYVISMQNLDFIRYTQDSLQAELKAAFNNKGVNSNAPKTPTSTPKRSPTKGPISNPTKGPTASPNKGPTGGGFSSK